MPKSLALTYYDADRDYQSGQMQATTAARGGIDETVELPIVIQATHAKALAEGHIARRWAERDRLVLWLSPDFISIEPGSLIATKDGVTWRVQEATIDGLAVRLDLLRVAERVASVPAHAGAHLPAPDVVASPTSFGVLDLPDLGTGRHDVPVLHIAACQPVAGWRQVPFEINVGGEVRTIASAPSEAIVGAALDVLAAFPSVGVDDSNSVEVQLSNREHWLESRDDGAMAQGANLAAIGRELVQFGRAVALGEGRFRLEHLLRGRRGTEYAVDGHGPGETFVLISSGGLREIALPPSAIRTSVSIRPMGLADDGAETIVCQVTGENMRPPAPVDLQAQPIAEGGLLLQWTRRSRVGWDWPSGSEPPLGENSERYRIALQWTGGSLDLTATEPRLEIAADTLGNVSGDLTITVVQIGDFAESRPASISITI